MVIAENAGILFLQCAQHLSLNGGTNTSSVSKPAFGNLKNGDITVHVLCVLQTVTSLKKIIQG